MTVVLPLPGPATMNWDWFIGEEIALFWSGFFGFRSVFEIFYHDLFELLPWNHILSSNAILNINKILL